MNVFMVINYSKPSAVSVAQMAAEFLSAEGANVVMGYHPANDKLQGFAPLTKDEENAYKNSDVVLCVGGDGTMLHAAAYSMRYQKPLLGINSGRLGFLTSIEKDEFFKLKLLLQGKYIVTGRKLLCADISFAEDEPCIALNDVVLFKDSPEKTIAMDIYCDDILVSRFRGDGIIFSTPTGSSAYSMSAGGPIVDAKVNGFIITQICAHIMRTPPLVVSSKRVVKAVSTGAENEVISVSCDGGKSRVLRSGQTVIITQPDQTVPLVQFDDMEQLKSIDTKLKGR